MNKNKMKIVAIIQARCGSTRFPNKVFAELCGKPLIWHVVNRLRFSKMINEIVLATTCEPLDDTLYEWGKKQGIKTFRGSQNDVLNRYFNAAQQVKADIIVRVTADDPFKDPQIIDEAVKELLNKELDFVCNNNPPTYPEGLDVEVFTRELLALAESKSTNDFEREHVTQYFYKHFSDFKVSNISYYVNLSYLRWTIDTDIDMDMVKKIYAELYKGDDTIFNMDNILTFLKAHPHIAEMNKNVKRSEMYKSK